MSNYFECLSLSWIFCKYFAFIFNFKLKSEKFIKPKKICEILLINFYQRCYLVFVWDQQIFLPLPGFLSGTRQFFSDFDWLLLRPGKSPLPLPGIRQIWGQIFHLAWHQVPTKNSSNFYNHETSTSFEKNTRKLFLACLPPKNHRQSSSSSKQINLRKDANDFP